MGELAEKLQRVFFLVWLIGGGALVRYLLTFSLPTFVVFLLGMTWLLGILPAILFSAGYHESPNYRQRPSMLDDAKSAMRCLGEWFKYMLWLFLIAIVVVAIGGIGYSD